MINFRIQSENKKEQTEAIAIKVPNGMGSLPDFLFINIKGKRNITPIIKDNIKA